VISHLSKKSFFAFWESKNNNADFVDSLYFIVNIWLVVHSQNYCLFYMQFSNKFQQIIWKILNTKMPC